ncbi:ankyrin [Thozetella sp. PMI_491]|nr:ankyrin [Thozetella sp. PMI_491]
MHILDLPPELLNKILYFSILARSLPRALRLKLVCKAFYVAFRPVLYDTRILDDVEHLDWHNCKSYGADILWRDYLAIRCHNETDESSGFFVEMRNLAKNILRECETQREDRHLDLDAVLKGLCWLALERGGRAIYYTQGTKLASPGPFLLSAATYFGCKALVGDLLSQGYDPTRQNGFFPTPMYIAAWTGQVDMISILQDHLPDSEEPDPALDWVLRSKREPGLLDGAVARGDFALVQFALSPSSGDHKQQDEAGEVQGGTEEPGSISTLGKQRYYAKSVMMQTRSPDIYQCLKKFFGTSSADSALINEDDEELVARAAKGHLDMVRYLLDNGADLAADPPLEEGMAGPLVEAIWNWHEDVVDLLLERGADPDNWGRFKHVSPLTAAANAGSMSIFRKLLDAGATLDKNWIYTLTNAIRREHTTMVEFLLHKGVASGSRGPEILEMARTEGLESMADLILPWVKVDNE